MRIVEFEICHQPQNTQTLQLINALTQNGFVVQLDRITDFGSVGWGFESLRGHLTGKITFRSDFSFFYFVIDC